MQHRNPARSYEIHIMRDLVGFDRSGWTNRILKLSIRPFPITPASPAGPSITMSTRSIFPTRRSSSTWIWACRDCSPWAKPFPQALDLRQLRRADRLREAGDDLVTCATRRRFRSRKWPTSPRRRRACAASCPRGWNARNGEYDPASSKVLHFTQLRTQPWRPFPGQFRDSLKPEGRVWLELERSRFRGIRLAGGGPREARLAGAGLQPRRSQRDLGRGRRP